MTEDYSGCELIPTQWPVARRSGDRWTRTWSVRLAQPARSTAEELAGRLDSSPFKSVSLVLDNDRAWLEVTGSGDEWDDAVYFDTYRLLERLDREVGGLIEIEGLPRDHWPPWRSTTRPRT